jgi:hypothetical protein
MVIRQPKTIAKLMVIFITSACLGSYILDNSFRYSGIFYSTLQLICGLISWAALMFLLWEVLENAKR